VDGVESELDVGVPGSEVKGVVVGDEEVEDVTGIDSSSPYT